MRSSIHSANGERSYEDRDRFSDAGRRGAPRRLRQLQQFVDSVKYHLRVGARVECSHNRVDGRDCVDELLSGGPFIRLV